MSSELLFGLITLFGTAAVGMPVAYAIVIGVLVYLGLAGQDLAIAGETMVQRLFDGFLLLAVPLFIVSANIMNAGSISDRLLKFCVAASRCEHKKAQSQARAHTNIYVLRLSVIA